VDNATQLKAKISERAVAGTINVQGAEVSYYDSGEPAAGSAAGRLPIVLVHGTGGSAFTHYGYLFPILEMNQRVVAIDLAPLPGQESLTLEALEAQVAAVIEAVLTEQQVTLVGYSLGAVIAASLAAKRQHLVKNLVLIAGWMKTDVQQQLRNSVWQGLYENRSRAIADYTIYCAFSHSFYNFVTAEQVAMIAESIRPGPFEAQQMELNRSIDLSDQIRSVSARTLIVGCSQDQMVPVMHSKLLFGAINDARLIEIESGHGVVFERPGQLSQIVDQFNENPDRYPAGTIIPADRP
jgi:pimeloyl-ACP methyl ester carboxylesterase